MGGERASGSLSRRRGTDGEGGLESEEREFQKLISVVAGGASEFVSRNQLIKYELFKMKNGEM